MEYNDFEQRPTKQSFLIRLVIKLSGGTIKTEKEASKALLIVAILFFVLSVYFLFK